MKRTQKTVDCTVCGTPILYRTTKPFFCADCYKRRRNDRRAGRDTSAPVHSHGFQPGHRPWNEGLTIADSRVAGYAAKLRLIDRAPVTPTGSGSIRRANPGTRTPRCRLCRSVEGVAVHHIDLNTQHNRRTNRLLLCPNCREAVIRLVGRPETLLNRLLKPRKAA